MADASESSGGVIQPAAEQHVRQGDSVAEQWRMRSWCRSSDCQHLVHILLTRRREPRLSQILAIEVPSFLMLAVKDAFLEALASQNLSDQILQTTVIEFLATWRLRTFARVSDLEADPQIAAVVDQLLPESLTLVEWLERRMQRDIALNGEGNTAIVHITPHGYDRWTAQAIGPLRPTLDRLVRRRPRA